MKAGNKFTFSRHDNATTIIHCESVVRLNKFDLLTFICIASIHTIWFGVCERHESVGMAEFGLLVSH